MNGGTVGPELERRLRQILAAAVGPAVQLEMDRNADAIASDAATRWYQQVTRRTGKSGRWSAALRVNSLGIQAAVVSGDVRQQGGKFATYYIRRPGPNATVSRPLADAEYKAAISTWRDTGELPANIEAKRAGSKGSPPSGLRAVSPHPLRGDGRVVLQELVLKPGRRAGKALAARLAAAVARGAR
jgi:hypothetical protein